MFFFSSLLLFCLAFLKISSASRSTAQRIRRANFDPIPETNEVLALESAHVLLETIATLSDPNLIREAKRTFLQDMFIVSKQTSSSKKGKAKESTNTCTPPHWVILAYPTFVEALELCFTELSASEAVAFARAAPMFFFQAPPAILEAISDYSAFTAADVKIEKEYHLYGFLLDIEPAVRTLSLDALIQGLENVSFLLNPRQQELIKCRLPELIDASRHDIRLVYQFTLLYAGGFDLTYLKNPADLFSEKAPTSLGTKNKKKKGQKNAASATQTSSKEDQESSAIFNFEAESPAKHPIYGNLINAGPVIAAKASLSDDKWKMLAFSYAVYTDTLMEQIFGAIVPNYPKFVGFSEQIFIKFHQLLISDLKKIVIERSRLLNACQDKTLKLLLSTPLSRQVRDALAAVNEETKDILITQPVTPFTLQQWLWAQVKSGDNKQEFPFQVRESREIFHAFNDCFHNPALFERFRYSYVSEIFISHLLFGEKAIVGDFRIELSGFFMQSPVRYIKNFGNIPQLIPEINSPRNEIGKLLESVVVFYVLFCNSKPAEDAQDYAKLAQYKHSMMQIVQFTIPSDLLLKTLREAVENQEKSVDGLAGVVSNENMLITVFKTFPEILGNHHWAYLIENGFCPEEFVRNFTGNMILYHGDAIELPKLDHLNRGLFAVSTDKVIAFLRASNFMVDHPNLFIELLNPQVFKDLRDNPSLESVEFFNFMTPWLHGVCLDTLKRWHFDDALKAYFDKTQDSFNFVKLSIQFIIRIEMNHLQKLVNPGANTPFYVGMELEEIAAETSARKKLSAYIKSISEKLEKAEKDVMEGIEPLLAFGPISPARSLYLRKRKSECEAKLEENPKLALHLKILQESSCRRIFSIDESPAEMVEKSFEAARRLFEIAAIVMPDNDLNHFHFGMATLEKGIEARKLRDEIMIPAKPFKKALAGQFKTRNLELCQEIQKRMRLNFDGEFVTQDWEAVQEDIKEQKRQEIRLRLKALGK